MARGAVPGRLFAAMPAAFLFAAAMPAQADTGGVATYLKARAADGDGRADLAVAGYARVLAAAPASTVVAARAYREALAAGDIALATRAAAILRGTPDAPADLPLLPLAQAAARNDPAGVEAAVADLARTPLGVLAPSLRAWLAVSRGRDPAPALAAAGKSPVTQRLAAETAALLRIAQGDADGGIAAVQALREAGSPIDLRLAAGQLLFGTGHAQQARALLTGSDPVFAALRSGVAARPTLGYGVARLLGRVAGDLADQDAAPLSIALARTALVAYPDNDRIRLLLAGALAQDKATGPALAALDAMSPDSPFAAAAVDARITILSGAGRGDAALALARGRAERTGATPADWQRYADRLMLANRFADAAAWYRRIVDAAPDAAGWSAWLHYGGALEQAGAWPAARDALRRAVVLAPREPLALNYLGYAQAERGENVAAATTMLERAHALSPEDHSIADSLGWAYYMRRETARALPLIESAAAGDPVNAEIGEHLGDIYWAVGRRYEARYAWRAAALTAAPADAPRLAAKIATGLPRR
ncbi:hypothetical protein LPN01_01255 [Sphingomonas sp. A2-49]|uniref:hypothetical protein n=1 Tax=Sphingomonas sp. A2-49 TaxID=1391375 RepID=UPI0021CE8A21|nr:hypothetical protein [Sphingomonas sp. A2-49]MCU6452699.1 hypothetical protein [Sphingomonas sp. A2-49]